MSGKVELMVLLSLKTITLATYTILLLSPAYYTVYTAETEIIIVIL